MEYLAYIDLGPEKENHLRNCVRGNPWDACFLNSREKNSPNIASRFYVSIKKFPSKADWREIFFLPKHWAPNQNRRAPEASNL